LRKIKLAEGIEREKMEYTSPRGKREKEKYNKTQRLLRSLGLIQDEFYVNPATSA
jgi:hypothetical protein